MIKLTAMNDIIKIIRSVTYALLKAGRNFSLDFVEMTKDPQDNAQQLVLVIGILIVLIAAVVTLIYSVWTGIKNRGQGDVQIVDDGFPKEDRLKVK